jgi:hypothetical protein
VSKSEPATDLGQRQSLLGEGKICGAIAWSILPLFRSMPRERVNSSISGLANVLLRSFRRVLSEWTVWSGGDRREEIDHIGMKKLTTWVLESLSFNRGFFLSLLSQ